MSYNVPETAPDGSPRGLFDAALDPPGGPCSATDTRAVPSRFGRSRVEVRSCRVLAEVRQESFDKDR
jgi:hypothetical protein